eukprot:737247_1
MEETHETWISNDCFRNLPYFLPFRLKRFSETRENNNKQVVFPLEIDMNPYVYDSNGVRDSANDRFPHCDSNGGFKYDLRCALVYDRSVGGHFTCFVRTDEFSYLCNDNDVTSWDNSDENVCDWYAQMFGDGKDCATYVLFYCKQNLNVDPYLRLGDSVDTDVTDAVALNNIVSNVSGDGDAALMDSTSSSNHHKSNKREIDASDEECNGIGDAHEPSNASNDVDSDKYDRDIVDEFGRHPTYWWCDDNDNWHPVFGGDDSEHSDVESVHASRNRSNGLDINLCSSEDDDAKGVSLGNNDAIDQYAMPAMVAMESD